MLKNIFKREIKPEDIENLKEYIKHFNLYGMKKIIKRVGVNVELDSDGNTPLHLAAYEGNIMIIDFLIGEVVKINPEEKVNAVKNKIKLNPLELLLLTGYIGYMKDTHKVSSLPQNLNKVCSRLEKNGAKLKLEENIANPSSESKSPIYYALKLGNYDAADLLIKDGAKIDSQTEDLILETVGEDLKFRTVDENGNIIIHEVAKGNHINLMKALCDKLEEKKGKDFLEEELNRENNLGNVPMYYALENAKNLSELSPMNRIGKAKMHYTLFDKGANLKYINKFGSSIEQLLEGNEEGLKLFKELEDWFREKFIGAINKVVLGVSDTEEHKKLKIVENLLKCGADPNQKLRAGDNYIDVFDLAIEKDHAKLIKMLVEYRADLNVKYKDGKTPLIKILEPKTEDERIKGKIYNSISHEDRKELIKLFIEKGADVNHIDEHGLNPLYYAHCAYLFNAPQNQELFSLLIEKGANINECLCIAAKQGNFELVNDLINKGADVNYQEDSVMSNALSNPEASSIFGMRTIATLVEHGADNKNNLLIKSGFLDKYSKEVLNYKDRNGNTMVHKAAIGGNLELIKALGEIEVDGKSFDFHHKNKQGKTPLDIVLENNNISDVKEEMVQYLKDKELSSSANIGDEQKDRVNTSLENASISEPQIDENIGVKK